MTEQSRPDEKQASQRKNLNVGRQLQNKRRELKLSIQEVSDQMRLRPEVIKAMEANRFSEMSEPVYTRGFLRTYASFLGLNGHELVQVLEKQEQLPHEREMNLPTPVEEGALPSKSMLFASLGVLLLIALVWQGVSWLTPETRDALPDMPRNVPEQVLNDTPASDADGVEASKPAEPAPAFQTPTAVEVDAHQAVEPQPVPQAPEGARIRLYAEEEVWIRVKHPENEEPVISEVLEVGRSYWVPPRDGLALDVGLPPALIVYIDEERMGKSGMIDRRVWNLPLIAEYLKTDYFGQGVHLTPSQQKSIAEPASEGGEVEDVVVEDEQINVEQPVNNQ